MVVVGGGHPDFRTEFRFPRYGVCDDELDKITNASPIGRAAVKLEYLRLSQISEELMAEDKKEERGKWLEDGMSEKFSGLEDSEGCDPRRSRGHRVYITPKGPETRIAERAGNGADKAKRRAWKMNSASSR